MAGHRIKRVNEQLKREISRIVVREVSDPRVGRVTVTAVSAAPDLTFARVHVQLLGEPEERDESMEGLRAATPYIRTLLAARLDMRRVPELRFERDESMERAMRIEELLADAATGEERERERERYEAEGEVQGEGEGEGEGEG